MYQPQLPNITFYATQAFTYAPKNLKVIGSNKILDIDRLREAAFHHCNRVSPMFCPMYGELRTAFEHKLVDRGWVEWWMCMSNAILEGETELIREIKVQNVQNSQPPISSSSFFFSNGTSFISLFPHHLPKFISLGCCCFFSRFFKHISFFITPSAHIFLKIHIPVILFQDLEYFYRDLFFT